MNDPNPRQSWSRQELLSLLSVCSTLAGLSITIVAFINARKMGATTDVDDLLAGCAAIFLGCIYLIFWALKTRSPQLAQRLVRIIDGLVLFSLTLMTMGAFIMVYTVW